MDIKAKSFILELTRDELWNIAFDVQRALEKSINEHWVNHQRDWMEHERERMTYCLKMFSALGRPELFCIEDYAKRKFKEFDDAKLERRKKEQNEVTDKLLSQHE